MHVWYLGGTTDEWWCSVTGDGCSVEYVETGTSPGCDYPDAGGALDYSSISGCNPGDGVGTCTITTA